jgi:large subunit ribosomal protein L3
MMGLIGRKVGMTQIFSDQGEAVPVTVLEVGPCTVTELRTESKDGYNAVQLGFGTQRESRMARPLLGQFKKRNLTPSRVLREFRVDDLQGLELGQSLKVDLFEKGRHVDVIGVTKGRGFTGVVKRYGFVAGHASHGPTHGKQPGSIGASAFPSRVVKGKRLPGRMGTDRHTARNLEVIGIDAEQNVLMVRGAVPGPTRGLVLVHKRKD